MKSTFRMAGTVLSLVVAGLMIATPATAASAKTIKVGIGYNEQSPQYKGLQRFKELVEANSNGRLKVDLFGNSQLGDDTKMMTSLRAGTLEMTMPSTAPIAGLDKKWMVFDLPFLFPNEDVADKVLDGPFGQNFLDTLPSFGIIGMAFWENGFQIGRASCRERV